MKGDDSLQPEDQAALDKTIRRTAALVALRRLHRFIADENAAERSVRKLALAVLAVFLVAFAAFAILTIISPWPS